MATNEKCTESNRNLFRFSFQNSIILCDLNLYENQPEQQQPKQSVNYCKEKFLLKTKQMPNRIYK